MYEAIEYIEEEENGLPTGTSLERVLGTFETEDGGVAAARDAMIRYGDRHEYAWWIVRKQGERIAAWIADSRSGREFLMDLTKEEIVDLQ
jgi:hypothetical protein